MADTIRWGILGTGNIARAFADDLPYANKGEIVAVGSRAQDTADAFAEPRDIPHRHASYEALAEDPYVDIVYVATPHPHHKANTLLCLEAGKAVLCEKPFAINAAEGREMTAKAHEKKRFLMEAMWTRFFPLMGELRQLIAQGALGEVRLLTADFGFRCGWKEDGRLLDRAEGGGSLLDVGVYAVSLASMIFGQAKRVATLAHLGVTHVDEQAGYVLGYPAGRLAVLHSAIRTETPQEATICGTEGRVRIEGPFWQPHTLRLSRPGKDDVVIERPNEGRGFHYEADAAMACLRAGQLECDLMPHQESIEILETMDAIRAQWGLAYPMEPGPEAKGAHSC